MQAISFVRIYMANKTHDVKILVDAVLAKRPKPYSEDIIDEVCLDIERNSSWLADYRSLVGRLTVDVVNNWIGQYVKDAVGGQRIRQVPASSSLIKSYSKLKI